MSSTLCSQQEPDPEDVLSNLLRIDTAFLSPRAKRALVGLQNNLEAVISSDMILSPDDRRMVDALAQHYLPRCLKGMPARGDSPKPGSPNPPFVPSAQTGLFPLGELLERYDDVAQISAGKLSYVYKAKYPSGHENSGQDVIHKVPVPNDRDSDTAWQAEHHALQTLKRVRHLHIISMNDAHTMPYPCIELEYMPGGRPRSGNRLDF